MSIDGAQVKRIAELSRLKISSEESSVFGPQLVKILDHINKLEELDTKDIKPTSHVIELTNVLREDKIKKSLSTDEVLGNAPDRSGNFYRVPKIID